MVECLLKWDCRCPRVSREGVTKHQRAGFEEGLLGYHSLKGFQRVSLTADRTIALVGVYESLQSKKDGLTLPERSLALAACSAHQSTLFRVATARIRYAA